MAKRSSTATCGRKVGNGSDSGLRKEGQRSSRYVRRTKTDPIIASKEWIEDAKIHLIRNCSLKHTVKYRSQDCRGRGGGIRLQGDGAQLSRWRGGTLKWILGRSDVSFSPRANPDTCYTLRVVLRVCQYATTPRCEHQKTKDNSLLLDYPVRNENSIQSIHM